MESNRFMSIHYNGKSSDGSKVREQEEKSVKEQETKKPLVSRIVQSVRNFISG